MNDESNAGGSCESASDAAKSFSLSATAQNSDGTAPHPFLKWAGGKTQLLHELRTRVPANFNNYYEPMIGAGALFFSLSPRLGLDRKGAFLSDVNPELINCYKAVRSYVEQLIKELRHYRYESDFFYQVRNADRSSDFLGWSPVKRAARLIYLNKCCFNGLYRLNSKGQFNVPFGRYKNPTICDPRNLRACSQVLKGANVAVANFEKVVENSKRGDFVYFDPPYLPVSKSASFTSYSKDSFSTEQHQLLADVCHKLDKKGVFFMLSNSHTEFAFDLYKDFKIEVAQATRAINSKKALRGPVPELIVRNY